MLIQSLIFRYETSTLQRTAFALYSSTQPNPSEVKIGNTGTNQLVNKSFLPTVKKDMALEFNFF
jgi:hypothetical protein